MKIDYRIKGICKICLKKKMSVGKHSEEPQYIPNIYTHMQAFVVKAM